MDSTQSSSLRKVIGPGIILACAAIGVSHLVQAVRAGADYQWSMLGFLFLACLTKWPFLEFGARYYAATGDDLLEGYRKLGRWGIPVYVVLTVSTMFIILAAVTVVTGALASALFGFGLSPVAWSGIMLGGSVLVLVVGRYAALDSAMKIIVVALTATTLIAVVAAIFGLERTAMPPPPSYWELAGFGFLLAMMGWMSIPIDTAVWHSLWMKERAKQTGHRATLREGVIDFNIGYWGSGVVGVMFLALGALIMYGSGETFPDAGAPFAAMFVRMYASALGPWSLPIVEIAAFTTMISTTMVVLDAYPRVFQRLMGTGAGSYRLMIVGFALAAWAVIAFSGKTLTALVDFATILSFLAAPLFAFMNFRVVMSKDFPEHARPGPWLRAISWFSLVFLVVFCGAYIALRLGWLGA